MDKYTRAACELIAAWKTEQDPRFVWTVVDRPLPDASDCIASEAQDTVS